MTDSDVPEVPAPDVPAPERDLDGMMGTAAVAIEVALLFVVVGGLIAALAFDVRPGVDELTVRVKLMSLSEEFLFGFIGVGGGVVVAIGLAVALALGRSAAKAGADARLLTAVGFGAVALSLWLGLLAALGVYVDVTEVAKADLAAAAALGDLATLVILVVTGAWGFALAGSPRR